MNTNPATEDQELKSSHRIVGATQYQITITRIEEIQIAGQEWAPIAQEIKTDRNGEPHAPTAVNVMGYVKVAKVSIDEATIYSQRIDILDIAKVIAAINGI